MQQADSTAQTPPNRPLQDWLLRYARIVQVISLVVIVISLAILAQQLPLGQAMTAFVAWVESTGAWGPLTYTFVYVVAVVMLVPGSAMALAAGLLFGLWEGVLIVSLASTAGAAATFLITRNFARQKVADWVAQHPRFSAIDRANEQDGWRIVALLRLAPIVLYSIINYVFGVMPLKFWPYLLTSWLAMLPGSFVNVYVGYLGGAGLARQERPPMDWTLMLAGLVLTLLITLYIVKRAREALREHMHEQPPRRPFDPHAIAPLERAIRVRGALVAAVTAAVSLTAAAVTLTQQETVRTFIGPPEVVAVEYYAEDTGAETFDHSLLNELLAAHVSEEGLVDYESLSRDVTKLDAYLEALAAAPFDALSRDDKLALLINAYNAFTLKLVVEHWPIQTIKDIPIEPRWLEPRWEVGDARWSLDALEHWQIRARFVEPRVHFALVPASRGGPPLRREAYTGEQLDAQLEDQARRVHQRRDWVDFDPQRPRIVHLTRLYNWYYAAFKGDADSVLHFPAQYHAPLSGAMEAGRRPRIDWLEYDWSLNAAH